jgi:hypothetical protein
MPDSRTWIFKAQRNILPGNVNNFDIHPCRTLSLFRPEFWSSDKEVVDSDGMITGHTGSWPAYRDQRNRNGFPC